MLTNVLISIVLIDLGYPKIYSENPLLLMIDLSTLSLLFIVNIYVLLALALFTLSVRELGCRLRHGHRCIQQHRRLKFIVICPLLLSCLALLAVGLFAIGISHGSRPENYQVVLFVVACLLPCVLLIVWFVGSLWMDTVWSVICTLLFIYLFCINPALYIGYWADDRHQWAQMWMATHYEGGSGGLRKSESMARSWFKKAALNGNQDAQYIMARSERRGKNARKWYLMAAEQGHPGAMVQVARLSGNREERQVWLSKAADKHHPEALFMLAQDAMTIDLALARQLLLEAADRGSYAAIVFLIKQYQEGGILFDKNKSSARQWQATLKETPPSDTDSNHLPKVIVQQTGKATQDFDGETEVSEAETLFRQAQAFLHHPAKDQILHKRAIEYLTRAANKGHGEAAVHLAKLANENAPSHTLNKKALNWYTMAATSDNPKALKQLAKYYKEKADADSSDLTRSLEFNGRLLELLPRNNTRERFTMQFWSSEYRDTKKKLAQLERLGGSWQIAIKQASESPHQEYRLAKELLDSRDYSAGMERMKSAAQRGSPDARYELARRTLNGPRSFTQEIHAVSELQALDQLGFAAASIRLGSLYQSGTGMVPQNLYLARQLFRKSINNRAQADPDLSKKAGRMLESSPALTDSLVLNPGDNPQQKINTWYKEAISGTKNLTLLEQQYKVLLEHFKDVTQLQQQAAENDANAQYQLAQSLQSYNLAEAMQWLQRAAENGNSDAQYELAIRMVRGKRNPPETQKALKKWLFTAADNGHVGAMVFAANQLKKGSNGFREDPERAGAYYLRAFQYTDADILFEQTIAGRSLSVKRVTIQKYLTDRK